MDELDMVLGSRSRVPRRSSIRKEAEVLTEKTERKESDWVLVHADCGRPLWNISSEVAYCPTCNKSFLAKLGKENRREDTGSIVMSYPFAVRTFFFGGEPTKAE